MTDNHSKLEQRILAEIQALQKPVSRITDPKRTTILGAYLEAALKNQGISKKRFAKAIGSDEELVNALLEGLLPESEIDDDWIVMVAGAVDTQPNILRIILGRTIASTPDDNSDEANSA